MININYLIKSSRRASKFLNRDFNEIGNLQNSPRIGNFLYDSKKRTREILEEKFRAHTQVTFTDGINDVNKNQTGVIINPLEGSLNFLKGMPFFGFVIIFQELIEDEIIVKNCLVDIPALGIIYFAERSQVACYETSFGERRKFKPSKQKENDLIVIDKVDAVGKLNLQEDSVRLLGSSLYSLYLALTGKIDMAIIERSNLDYATNGAISLLCSEVKVPCRSLEKYLILNSE